MPPTMNERINVRARKSTPLSQAQYNQAVARNTGLPCDVKGCEKRRYALSKFCPVHRKNIYFRGSPTLHSVKLREVQKYSKVIVPAFIRLHKRHVGIERALVLLDGMLHRPREHFDHPTLIDEFTYLAAHGVTAEDVLNIAISTYMAISRLRTHPDVTQAYHDAQVFRRIVRLAKRPVKLRTSMKTGRQYREARYVRRQHSAGRTLGDVFRREGLTRLFAHVRLQIQADQRNALKAHRDMTATFDDKPRRKTGD